MNSINNIVTIHRDPDLFDGLIDTVNARDLHKVLEVGRDFTNWVKDRLESCMFKENEDFVVYAKSGENPRGGRPAKEYFLSLDVAKHFAMLERNDQGFKVRQYFVEFEKQAKQKLPAQTYQELVADTLKANSELIARLGQEIEIRDAQIAVIAPKADVFDAHCGRTMTLRDFCRSLEGVNLQQVKADLVNLKYFYRGPSCVRVYSHYRDTEFVEKVNPHRQGYREIYVTQTGKQLLAKLYHDGKLTLKVNYKKAA